MLSEIKIKEAITNALKMAFRESEIYDLTDLVFDSIKPIIEVEKPDWNDAPEWATHLAQDFHGQWHWFRGEPKPDGQYWLASKYYNQRAFIPNQRWKGTLEKRPL